ncbi:MAG: FliG C-terminal domain-containing protein, partial [Armatimonadota bacterium]
SLVDILNAGDRGLERSILDSLADDDPELADEIKRKLFVFEDILQLDDKAIQTILREVEQEDLRLALRGSQDAVKEKVFGNMSERAASSLKEDMEMSGPVRLKDVEFAQQRIALVIRALEEKGEIVIARVGAEGSDEQFI